LLEQKQVRHDPENRKKEGGEGKEDMQYAERKREPTIAQQNKE